MSRFLIVALLGPYFGDGTHDAIATNIAEAERYAVALANVGIGFFCPHTHTRHFEIKANASEDFYHELDATIVRRAADAALFMPRWVESPGAQREHAEAQAAGLSCFYPASPDDLRDVVSWADLNR